MNLIFTLLILASAGYCQLQVQAQPSQDVYSSDETILIQLMCTNLSNSDTTLVWPDYLTHGISTLDWHWECHIGGLFYPTAVTISAGSTHVFNAFYSTNQPVLETGFHPFVGYLVPPHLTYSDVVWVGVDDSSNTYPKAGFFPMWTDYRLAHELGVQPAYMFQESLSEEGTQIIHFQLNDGSYFERATTYICSEFHESFFFLSDPEVDYDITILREIEGETESLPFNEWHAAEYFGWMNFLLVYSSEGVEPDTFTLRVQQHGNTNIKEYAFPPSEYRLSTFPNPANPSTTISYELLQVSDVSVSIYDLAGRQVWSRDLHVQSAGSHTLQWDGVNQDGVEVTSGVYIVQLSTPEWSESRKVVVLR